VENSDYLNRIASRIAVALTGIVPPNVRVVSGQSGDVCWGTTAWEMACGYPFTDNVLDNLSAEEPITATIEWVARNLLDALQQDMTMDLKVPWPTVADKPLGYVAAPMACVSSNTLRLWFEVEGSVLLSASISLSEVR
jgi:hypothetical protein